MNIKYSNLSPQMTNAIDACGTHSINHRLAIYTRRYYALDDA